MPPVRPSGRNTATVVRVEAVSESVTNGTSATTFSPDNNCTRAQIVTFIWRTLAD